MNDTVTAEITERSISEDREWGFVGTVKVRLNNPDGKDVIAIKQYKARPKHPDLTSEPQKVHEKVKYWWPDSYPARGDSPFDTQSVEWEPVTDIVDDSQDESSITDVSRSETTAKDDDALMEEIIDYNAVYDPLAEFESLLHNSSRRVRGKLGH
jgi:hypothetical protein